LAEADLAATAAAFLLLALEALAVFCEDFLFVDFGDLSPIILFCFYELTDLRHDYFLRREGDCAG
jgi:hypothetical protein